MTDEELADKYAEEYYYKSVFAETNPKSEIELKEKFLQTFKAGAEFGYNKAKEEHEGKSKTAYIKGIRTMANALKDYDRTEGAWTDYFEHTVEEVLKRLLKESE